MRVVLILSLFSLIFVGCRETLIDTIDDLAKDPGVIISKPLSGTIFIENDNVRFECRVRDYQDDVRDLSVQWESDVDGVLHTMNPRYDDGIVKFETRDLSTGTHIVEVTVTDSDGNTGSQRAEIFIRHIPVRPVIDSVSNVSEGLKISWSESVEPTFVAYKLWRLGPYELLLDTQDKSVLEFIDTEVLLGNNYRYTLWAHLASGDSTSSTVASAPYFGQSIPLAGDVTSMLLDPVRPLLYILSDKGRSLIVVNTETMTIVQSVTASFSSTDLSISLDNSELFVARSSGNLVDVYDIFPLSFNRSFQIRMADENGDSETLYGIEYMSGDFLACTAQFNWGRLNLTLASNGVRTDFYNQNIFEPSIVTSPDKTILYAGESKRDFTDTKLYKFEIVDSTFQVVQDHTLSNIRIRQISLSGDGEFLFYGPHKISSSDVRNVLGTFEEEVLASNHDGSVVLGVRNILNGNTFQAVRAYANTNISHGLFDPLHNSFLIYVKATNSLAIVELD